MKKAIVIGAGFSGLSAASFLAKSGWQVTVLEKHTLPGGRARKMETDGFMFDMGPSWYWMPGVFERYFNFFGKKVSDFYTLSRLDPSYRIYYPDSIMDIPADYRQLKELFESIEPGAGKKLDKFLDEAKYKYEVGINKLVHKPGRSLSEFADTEVAMGVLKLDVFTSMKKHVGRFFTHPKLQQLMEFPVLFLGALAQKIPALYSLMNYADIKLGTWYPQGGMYEIVRAMHQNAVEHGVKFFFEHEVTGMSVKNRQVNKVVCRKQNERGIEFEADVVVGSADYHHVETALLQPNERSYDEKYWNSRLMAPSCLLYYIGLNKKLEAVQHHSLFFDVDFDRHGKEIYEEAKWPTEPLFYLSIPSVTDSSVAPPGCENLFFLVPVAAGLAGDTELLRKKYFDMIVGRFEEKTNQKIKDSIIFYKSYSVTDFKEDYGAFKGNAYGLANTLMQTALLKPSLKSKKIKNLYFAGQLTVPGPGVPPALISGEVVAKEINKDFKIVNA
ncbi:MAG: phytoene desaturase family protein [Ferruginibacter sp.]